jgi:hypothetical protein
MQATGLVGVLAYTFATLTGKASGLEQIMIRTTHLKARRRPSY